MRLRRAPFVWGPFVMTVGSTGVGRTCFFNCFDSFTCACLSVEVFSRSSRGTARRRSTRRVEPPVARRNGGCRAEETYFFQTSSPSLSDTTSTSSKEIGMRGESLGQREKMWAAREACSPALRKSFRGAMHATPDRGQIQVFRLSIFTLEASFLLSHCM